MKKTTRRPLRRKIEVPKKCYFCEEKKIPNYSDVEVLTRFVTERGKIIGRMRSGICGVHHRKLSSSIKYARHLALLPFVARV